MVTDMMVRKCPKCGQTAMSTPRYDERTETLRRTCTCCGYQSSEPTKDELRKAVKRAR